MKIRLLTTSDHAEWLRLRQILWGDPLEQHEKECAEILANFDQMPVFVATRDEGGLCGLIELTIHKEAKGCKTDRIGYIEGWYVDADCRNQGVGQQLVQRGEAWARSQGCTEMASDTLLPQYPNSPAAHQALGYDIVEQAIYFKKELTSL